LDPHFLFNALNTISSQVERDAMRNCLVYGASVSGIWTVETDGDDFDFRNNVIANSRVVWIREQGGTRRYKAVASVFTDNTNIAAYGGAAGSSP
jgi:hypothetical protein